MFCEKCGAKAADNAAFCEACGNQFNATVKPNPPPKMSRKKLAVIIVAAAVLLAAVIIPVSIASCRANRSYEDMLTAHRWVHYYENKPSKYLTFYKNGTCRLDIAGSNTGSNGTWSVTGNQLKIKNERFSGTYNYWENLSETDIERKVTGNKYYSWYVSDKYFVICMDCIYGASRTEIYKAN